MNNTDIVSEADGRNLDLDIVLENLSLNLLCELLKNNDEKYTAFLQSISVERLCQVMDIEQVMLIYRLNRHRVTQHFGLNLEQLRLMSGVTTARLKRFLKVPLLLEMAANSLDSISIFAIGNMTFEQLVRRIGMVSLAAQLGLQPEKLYRHLNSPLLELTELVNLSHKHLIEEMGISMLLSYLRFNEDPTVGDWSTPSLDELYKAVALDEKAGNLSNVSGGEKQRISLANLLLKDPSMIIFDEATSALDLINESALLETLEAYRRRRNVTILSIAHRMSVIQNVDHIIMLNNEGKREIPIGVPIPPEPHNHHLLKSMKVRSNPHDPRSPLVDCVYKKLWDIATQSPASGSYDDAPLAELTQFFPRSKLFLNRGPEMKAVPGDYLSNQFNSKPL